MLKISYLGRLKSTSITPYEPFTWNRVPAPPLASANTLTSPPEADRASTWLLYTPTNGYEPATYFTNRYKTPPGICEYPYEPARGIPSWHLTAPYFCERLRIRYSIYVPSQRDPPPSGICEYLYEPARGTRAGTSLLYLWTVTDLLHHPYGPLRDPPGICEYPHEPARGIQSWHLTAPYFCESLRTVTWPPIPS
jgi:hypothetical protein